MRRDEFSAGGGGGADLVVVGVVAVGVGPVAVADGGIGIGAGGEGGTGHAAMEPPEAVVDGHVDFDLDRGCADADRVGIRGGPAGAVGDRQAGGEGGALDAGVGVPCLDLVEVGCGPGRGSRAIAEIPDVGHRGGLAPADGLEDGRLAGEGIVGDLNAALDLPGHAGHDGRRADVDTAGIDAGVSGVVGDRERQQIGPGGRVGMIHPGVAGTLALAIAEVPVVPADAEVVARQTCIQAGRYHLVGEVRAAVVGHGRGAGENGDHGGGRIELPGVVGDGHVRVVGTGGGVGHLGHGFRVPQGRRQRQGPGGAAEV